MIPLRDMNPTRSRPVLVWLLIAMNVAVFLYQVSLGQHGMQQFVLRFGVVPAHLLDGPFVDGYLTWVTPLTSMFMHGGWMHIIGNMWFLWIFGDNVEDRLGKPRFVVFYVVCGLAAAAAQTAVDPSSTVPMVGASGAISGVLAGYVLMFPHARVLTLVPIFIFLQFVELRAFLFIFIWFGIQLLQGTVSLGQVGTGQGGVAFFAHIGGFVAGLALTPLLRGRDGGPRGGPPRRRPRRSFEGDDSMWR